MLSRNILVNAAVFIVFFFAGEALAASVSCQEDWQKLMTKRDDYLKPIINFQKMKPTAKQACQAFGRLGQHNNKIQKWMRAQKNWCQITEDLIKKFDVERKLTNKRTKEICQQARKIERRRPDGQIPGSDIQLPKGAL